MGENLALFAFRQVGARRRRREEEPKLAWCEMLGQRVAFEKLPAGQDVEWVKDLDTARGLECYVTQSARDNDSVQPILNQLAISQQPVIIWGAGSHTLRLLATSRLAEAKLTAIVDSNPRYQGKSVNGIPIVKPDAIRGSQESILISTRVFQQSIKSQIKDGMRLDNNLVTLYHLD